MKYLLLLPLAVTLAALTGCEEEHHRHHHDRPAYYGDRTRVDVGYRSGYYDDRPRVRDSVVVEERPVVRERRVYTY